MAAPATSLIAPQGADLGFPVRNKCGLDLDHLDPWIVLDRVVLPVAQVAESGRQRGPIQLLDARVIVAVHARLARDGDPVLRLGVLQ
jgi:hypothetical protein